MSAADRTAPMGLALPVPAMSGAEPCTGSKIERAPGWMLPLPTKPMPPTSPAARSERISPKRLSVTITWKRRGWVTRRRAAASTCW